MKSDFLLDLRASRRFVRNESTRFKLKDEIKEDYPPQKIKLESGGVQITSVDVMRGGWLLEDGHMNTFRPQAGRFTSRREKSRRALNQDKIHFTTRGQILISMDLIFFNFSVRRSLFLIFSSFHIIQGDCRVRPS